jgi:hypothetical protein
MRIENSAEYEAETKKYFEDERKKAAKRENKYSAATQKYKPGEWHDMDKCPFEALSERYRIDGVIIVGDEQNTAIATVSERFGPPIFYEKEPEYVIRDGMSYLEGGIEKECPHPEWWLKWELIDVLETENEMYGKPEIDFVPTRWQFLPV